MQTDGNGLLYMRARYYSPELMRFLSEDTVVGSLDKVGSLNRYAFCGGNPVNYIDAGGNIPTTLEAAYMADHIYNAVYDAKNNDNNKVANANGWTFGGDLINVTDDIFGGMRMGYYYKTIGGVTEYAVVNMGSQSVSDWINNFEQVAGLSADLNVSINIAKEFVEAYSGSEITFIGHSKGGAEAYANALATNGNCITFNPAGLSGISYLEAIWNNTEYTGNAVAYIVKGELLDWGGLGKPQNIVYLPPLYSHDMVGNHMMKAVIAGLEGKNY